MNSNEEYSFSDYLRENKKKPIIIGVVILLLIAVVFVCTGIFTHKYGIGMPGDEASREASGEQAQEALVPIDAESVDLSNAKLINELEKVDLTARKHASGSRQKEMTWDDSFMTETGDKSVYRFIDKSDGKELTCEVYTDTKASLINKIVTIKEEKDGLLEVIDYYYHGNKPYFISQRSESVYTPVYESTEKPGVRFYFTDDVLVRSRTVVEGTMLVSQTGLFIDNNPDYEEFEYYTAPDVIKAQYDKFEQEWLNRGYNILNAVKKSKAIGRVSGKVTDYQGKELSGHKVLVQNASTGKISYAAETDSLGEFSINVELDGQDYRLCVLGDETLSDMYIYDQIFDKRAAVYEYNDIRLYHKDEDVCDVTLNVYDGDNFRSDIAGKSGVFSRICIREGYNNKVGEKIAECYTTTKGDVETALKPGCYTLETVGEGYATVYVNLEVTEYGCKKKIFVVKTPEAGKAKVLLTWDSDIDLDLTIFTPYQGSKGDRAHIGGSVSKDERGNSIAADNGSGCETGSIDLAGNGSFRAYVSNYSDIISGAYGSDDLCESNAAVYVFYEDGTSRCCGLSRDQYGVLWESVEVSGEGYSIGDRFYSNVGGKNWWLVNKSILSARSNSQLKKASQLTGRLESDFSYAYSDTDWINNKKYMLDFDAPVSISVSVEGTEQTITRDSIAVKFDLKQDYSVLSHLDLHIGQYITGTIKETGVSEDNEPYLVLESVSLLSGETEERRAVPVEYLGLLADRIKEGAVAYSVIYINDNDTPELVILNPQESAHESGAEIYTYDNGSVDLIGSFGSWGGNFTYYPMKNLIQVEETSKGSHSESYCHFDKYTVYTLNYESSLDFPEYGISKVMGQYTMNGTEYVNPIPGRGNAVPTEPEEYEKQMTAMFKNIDRNTGHYIDQDSCLRASKIEEIRFR